MSSTLGSTETARCTVRRTETWEALGSVEVEVSTVDKRAQAQEALYRLHLGGGVGDQSLTADEMKSVWGEVVEPWLDVAGVQAESDRTPHGVHHGLVPTHG